MLLLAVIFKPCHASVWQTRAGMEKAGEFMWLWSFLGIFLSGCWQSRNQPEHREVDKRPEHVWTGGVRGVNGTALLTLAFFACSAHRLIFRHPKYSSTCHHTVDTQPHKWQEFCKRKAIILVFMHRNSNHVFGGSSTPHPPRPGLFTRTLWAKLWIMFSGYWQLNVCWNISRTPIKQ